MLRTGTRCSYPDPHGTYKGFYKITRVRIVNVQFVCIGVLLKDVANWA